MASYGNIFNYNKDSSSNACDVIGNTYATPTTGMQQRNASANNNGGGSFLSNFFFGSAGHNNTTASAMDHATRNGNRTVGGTATRGGNSVPIRHVVGNFDTFNEHCVYEATKARENGYSDVKGLFDHHGYDAGKNTQGEQDYNDRFHRGAVLASLQQILPPQQRFGGGDNSYQFIYTDTASDAEARNKANAAADAVPSSFYDFEGAIQSGGFSKW